jgi:hypothetical protein
MTKDTAPGIALAEQKLSHGGVVRPSSVLGIFVVVSELAGAIERVSQGILLVVEIVPAFYTDVQAPR